MTDQELEELEKRAKMMERENAARDAIAAQQVNAAERAGKGDQTYWARQQAALDAENQRFAGYRKAAEQRKMENIRNHAEDYRPDERKMSDRYWAHEDMLRNEGNKMTALDKELASREKVAQFQAQGQELQGRGAVLAQGENAAAEFQRRYGDQQGFQMDQAAERASREKIAREQGMEAAKYNSEAMRYRTDSQAAVQAGHDDARRDVAKTRALSDAEKRVQDAQQKQWDRESRETIARIRSAKTPDEQQRMRRIAYERDSKQLLMSDEQIIDKNRKAGWTDEELSTLPGYEAWKRKQQQVPNGLPNGPQTGMAAPRPGIERYRV